MPSSPRIAVRGVPDLAKMPKADLHLHLEGSPRWLTVRQALNKHYNLNLPESPPWYEPQFRFTNFDHFRSFFQHYIHPWLKTPFGYAELIQDVVDSLLEQQVRYAELNCYFGLVERVGASLEAVLQLLEIAIDRARSQGLILKIIAGISRHEGIENADFWVKKLLPVPIISGFDLHGAEVGWSASLFQAVFAPIVAAGKKLKAHAGEMDSPESIRSAIEQLGVRQIGHGTSAIHDPSVVELLRDRHVLVEMCPTSNERLRNVRSYLEHPILDLDMAGVVVTINSDDSFLFGANLTREMTRIHSERSVSIETLVRWTHNAFNVAMVDEPTRLNLHSELDQWLQY
jgi:adenosine deaminase